ncbi:hypothetical protein FACS1894164_02730 [Spirochaetia bacterium]|nr:hypothetical protein FACS1894164_02730 [Spirochaetia bacterium]
MSNKSIAKKSTFLSLAFADFKFNVPLLKSVFSIGLPSFFMKVIYVAGFLVQNNVAASFGDIYISYAKASAWAFSLWWVTVAPPKNGSA